MKDLRIITAILMALCIRCGNDAPTGPNNTNAFYSNRYTQCQLETLTEDLATPDVDRFSARQFTGTRISMPYRLFIPNNYTPSRSYPLILYLHGGAGRGTDNTLQITTWANLVATHVFSSPEVQRNNPCFVVAPQVQEADGRWASFDPTSLSNNLITALEIVNALEQEFNIDQKRIYAVGNSLGGGGAWDLLTKGPDRFAAVMPMASDVNWAGIWAPPAQQLALDTSVAAALKGKNYWFFYGANDGNGLLKPWWDRVLVHLRKDGEDPKFTEYIDGEHSIFRCVFTEPDLVSWLFSHKL